MSCKSVYLSPSNQVNNLYVVGNTNENEQMEELSLRIKEILDTEYICETHIASPLLPITIEGRPREASDLGADVYLALHSNASPDHRATGAVAYYQPGNVESQLLARNIVRELGMINPIPSNRANPVINGMNAFQGKGYAEIRNPTQYGLIAVLAETDFHDNPTTARWIIDYQAQIARAYVNAIVETFDFPSRLGTVSRIKFSYRKEE